MKNNKNAVKQSKAAKQSSSITTRTTTGKSVKAGKVAANDARFDSSGIIRKPDFKVRFKGRGSKTLNRRVDATLYLHRLAEGWVCGFSYAVRSGECCGETLLPSTHDLTSQTRKQAIAAAAAKLLFSLAVKYPDIERLNKTEAALVKQLKEWASGFLPAEPPAEVTPKPLAEVRFIDLFAGIGGFRLGLESAGAKCVLTCEIDKAARQTYAANFDVSKHPFPEDITKLKAEDVPDHDILAGGFPCQAFSISGLRKGFDDPRGTLFFDVARIVEAKRPSLVILENVGNFLRLEGGKYARAAEEALASMGYAVSHKTIWASDFGLPQLRERVFFVAIRRECFKSEASFVFPVGTGCELTVADILEPNAPAGKVGLDRIVSDETRDSDSLTKRVGWINGNRRQTARVMSPDGIGLTLVTSKDGGGTYLVNGKARALTPRERARMQGFPESFILDKRVTHACKQLGNSVAVPVVQAIALAAANQVNFHQREAHQGLAIGRNEAANDRTVSPVELAQVAAPADTTGTDYLNGQLPKAA